MTDREPLLTIHQPPAEDLQQIAQIAAGWGANGVLEEDIEDVEKDFAAVMRLVLHALRGLSEPSAAACMVTYDWLFGDRGDPNVPADVLAYRGRSARDAAAAILDAALRGSGSRGEPT